MSAFTLTTEDSTAEDPDQVKRPQRRGFQCVGLSPSEDGGGGEEDMNTGSCVTFNSAEERSKEPGDSGRGALALKPSGQ